MSTQTTTARTVEQQRAAFALECVLAASTGDKGKEYGRWVRRLPAMIMQNGMGQALAFLLSDTEGKNDKPSGHVYDDLAAWLTEKRKIYDAAPSSDRAGKLLKPMMVGGRGQYMAATEEVQALLAWLKRFCDAYGLKGKD